MPDARSFAPLPPSVSDAERKRAWKVGLPGYLQHDFYTTYFAARAAKLFGVS